jgi:hypothetical protein
MRFLSVLLLAPALLAAACGGQPEPAPVDEAAAPGEWEDLFDGHGFEHWRGYGQDSMPDSWAIIEGAMYNAVPGTDLVTRAQYADFEIEFEWKLEPGGNSGVMFRVTEDRDYPWMTGPEYQLFDNPSGGQDLRGIHAAGANYDVHPADTSAAHPAGAWNAGRILVRGSHVEHWLNGAKVVEYELMSPGWLEAVAGSKWAAYPDYGRRAQGHVALQGDHEPVWFRNMRIRRL